MPSMSINDLAQSLGIDPAAPPLQDKTVYFFPQNLGDQLAQQGLLQSMALQLSIQSGGTIWVHYDPEKRTYRVGAVVDIEDCRAVFGCVMVHREGRSQLGGPLLQLHHLPQLTPGSHNTTPPAQTVAPGLQVLTAPAAPIATTSQVPVRPAATLRSTSLKIPKPRNSWIIYRQEKHHLIAAAYPKLHTSKLSQIISKMWRGEPEEVKAHYAQLAEGEKNNHRILYPGYKCTPRKSSQIKKRKSCKESTNTQQDELIEVHAPAVAARSPSGQISAASAAKYRQIWFETTLKNAGIVPEIDPLDAPGNDFSHLTNTTAEYSEQEYQIEESDGFNPFYDWN